MYCRECGNIIDDTAKYCPECGTSIYPNTQNVKTAKPVYRQWWFWVICAVLVVALVAVIASATGKKDTPENVSAGGTIPAPAAIVTEATTEPTVAEAVPETVAPVDDSASVSVSIDTAVAFIEASMKDSFENYEISHSDNIITINVWQEGVAVGAALAIAGDEDCLDAWNVLLENQVYCCETILELVQTLGLKDTAVVLNVLNDDNLENVLLSTVNGIVYYNIVED